MAVDMFLELEGSIEGEAKDEEFEKTIDILAWSWGLSQSGSFHTGGGGGAGKCNVQDISITKYVDRSSANLMQFCASGKHFEKGRLIVRKAGGETPLKFLEIRMKNILVSSVSTGGSGGEDRLTENVTLNFAKVELDYIPQKEDGTGDGKVPFTWDIERNTKEIG